MWAPPAKLTIEKWDEVEEAWGDCPVCHARVDMGAEINATGKVVYGFNWVVGRKNTGDYRLKFQALAGEWNSPAQEIEIDRSGGGGKPGGGGGGNH